uniref:ATP synthase F0 subunit 8 n=1 Tax=Pseudoneureclipsis achim TaxID=623285 RepID=A0A9E8LP67_9NEOP|nr:ATP synthase F0 subunit 8 [Pseudoneureclipsis achim]UZZ44276.1 ATP synthase F0 subunit 8 [Pseudoneureclipsis achim]
MPQMNPMNWTSLYLMFSLLMIMLMSNMFFNHLNHNNQKTLMNTNKLMQKKLTWK